VTVLGPATTAGRAPSADDVVGSLRRMILVGELPPGSRTTQDELAQRLGVSTMPVRKALLQLAAEGLIEVSPRRSFRVAQTTPDDIRDVYWIQARIAGELAHRAARAVDGDGLAELAQAHDAFCAAGAAGRAVDLEAANWRFHRLVNRAAASPKLLLTLRTSLRFIPDDFYCLVPDWAPVSERGHRRILDALAARHPDEARAAAEDHVREAAELLLSSFSNKGFWRAPGSAGVERTVNWSSRGTTSE
jgi:DNA-binding GntR family transcriptional regulator